MNDNGDEIPKGAAYLYSTAQRKINDADEYANTMESLNNFRLTAGIIGGALLLTIIVVLIIGPFCYGKKYYFPDYRT